MFVVGSHSSGGEAGDGLSTARVPIQVCDVVDRFDHCGFAVAEEAAASVFDELGRGTYRSSDDRRPTGHGFDHHETEGFGPLDRKHHRVRVAEKIDLGAMVDVLE